MKKINVFLLIAVLMLSMFVNPYFVEEASAIGQHETVDGTAIGYIENSTVYEGLGHMIYSSQDVSLMEASPDSNYNSDNLLRIYNNTEIADKRFLLEFNISTIPSEATITQATVYLYAMGAVIEYNVYAHRVTGIWDETTVTWNTMPAYNGTYTAVQAVVEDSWNLWDVTTDIQHFMDSNYTNYGWLFQRPGTSNIPDYNVLLRGKPTSGVTYDPFISIEYAFHFNVTRDVSAISESNKINFSCLGNYSDNVNLKIPVSDDVRGIVDVTNNTGNDLATEVNNTAYLVNGSYWYDSANQYVYIRTINLTYGMVVNWTVNCSYGITFNIPIPTYKEVGDDIIMSGRILNSTGVALNVSARTHVYNSSGVDVVTPVHEWFCHYGNYYASIPTSGLIPGVYGISIEIVDPGSGITFKYGDSLYLSFETPDGVYSDALVYFNFYNTNIGLGLIPETFKVYIDDVRIYEYKYYGYTGETINITIRDYYDFVMKTVEHTIVGTYTGLNFGLTFHEYDFTNENSEYYYASFLKYNAFRWYEKVVASSGGQKSFMLPSGNYTVRVYNADNSSYTSWTETINRSKAYLIGTDGVSLIIQGQSVIIGNFLELSETLDYALMRDAIIWSTNPPIIISCFDRIGMELGQNIWKVCPALNVIATTRNATTGNWINSTYLIPSNGTTKNGTITLLEDTIYIYGNGSVNWVNLTYTDNGTLYQNTTYIPGMLHVFGEKFTINASCDIRVERETRYNQLKKFYWNIHNSTINPGYIPGRAGYHTAGIDVINSLNTTLYDVYVFAGFSDKTTPDTNRVRVRDVENDKLLERGENFKTTEDGIDFRLTGSMNASTTRKFVIEYYSDFSSNYIYDDGNVEITSFETNKKYGSRTPFYNYFVIPFTNDRSLTFRGGIFAILNLRMLKTEIDLSSVLIRDLDNNIEVSRSDCVVGQGFIILTSEIVGDLPPGGGRNFGVYFLESEYPGADPKDIHLNTNLGNFLGIPWTPFFIIFLILCIPMAVGVVRIVWDKSKKLSRLNLVITVVPFVFIFVLWILSAKGL